MHYIFILYPKTKKLKSNLIYPHFLNNYNIAKDNLHLLKDLMLRRFWISQPCDGWIIFKIMQMWVQMQWESSEDSEGMAVGSLCPAACTLPVYVAALEVNYF